MCPPYFKFFLTLFLGASFHFQTCPELSYIKNDLKKYKKLYFSVFSHPIFHSPSIAKKASHTWSSCAAFSFSVSPPAFFPSLPNPQQSGFSLPAAT